MVWLAGPHKTAFFANKIQTAGIMRLLLESNQLEGPVLQEVILLGPSLKGIRVTQILPTFRSTAFSVQPSLDTLEKWGPSSGLLGLYRTVQLVPGPESDSTVKLLY